jgi:hypothetical protein
MSPIGFKRTDLVAGSKLNSRKRVRCCHSEEKEIPATRR